MTSGSRPVATGRPPEPRYVARGYPGDVATWWYVLDRATGQRDAIGHGEGARRIAAARAAARNASALRGKRRL